MKALYTLSKCSVDPIRLVFIGPSSSWEVLYQKTVSQNSQNSQEIICDDIFFLVQLLV